MAGTNKRKAKTAATTRIAFLRESNSTPSPVVMYFCDFSPQGNRENYGASAHKASYQNDSGPLGQSVLSKLFKVRK